MIAGAGFARMAWELAQERTWLVLGGPMRREIAVRCPRINPASAAYYRICDFVTSKFKLHPTLYP